MSELRDGMKSVNACSYADVVRAPCAPRGLTAGWQQPRPRHRRDAYSRRRGNECLLQVGGLLR